MAKQRQIHASAVPVSADRQAKLAVSANDGNAIRAGVNAVPSMAVAFPIAPAEAIA